MISQFTQYDIDDDSRFSEMISPTMMMETEVDTDTETQEESDERNNIYEEVLNSDTCRRRHGRTKLAATSSIYRNSWWEGSAGRYQV